MIVSLFSFNFCSKPSILLAGWSRCFLFRQKLPPVHILKVCQSCLGFLVNRLNIIVNLINISAVLGRPYHTIMTIMITLTRSLLITSSCSQIVLTMRGSTGLAVTLSMLPFPLIRSSIIMVSSPLQLTCYNWPRPVSWCRRSLPQVRASGSPVTPRPGIIIMIVAVIFFITLIITLIAARQSFVILAVDFFCSPNSHSMSFNLWLPMWLPSSPCSKSKVTGHHFWLFSFKIIW